MSHVLAVRLDSEGDVLLAGPAIRAIAAGADRVTLLCGPRGRQAAGLLPGVDDIRVWHAPWIDPEPEPVRRDAVDELVAEVAALAPDRALIFGSFHQSPLPTALLLRLAGVPWIGASCVDYPGSLLDLRHRIGDGVHEVRRALSLASAAGYELPDGDDGRLAVRHERPRAGSPYVVVHPGASVPARAWAPEHHARLVELLAAGGRGVVVTGAPSERELTARFAGRPRAGVTDLGGATTLGGLAGVLAGADAVVVGNTGPAHLAAAVGTPVVSLYALTVPAVRWRPWLVPHELLSVPVPCAGCRARACPVEGHPCVDDIEPEDVLAALDRLAPLPEAVAA
jgi:ADP-heptose:LPS heptosyltransferase